MIVGRCSQCGGRVKQDMEGNQRCETCGSFKPCLPVIDMPPPSRKQHPGIDDRKFPCNQRHLQYWCSQRIVLP